MRKMRSSKSQGLLGVVGAAASVVGGIIGVGKDVEEWDVADRQRKERFELGSLQLETKGNLMAANHMAQHELDLNKIHAMSNKVIYPHYRNDIIFRAVNQTFGFKDIYMVQYFPSGGLKKFIDMYYEQYGYEIMVRKFVCMGIGSIKKHLKYSTIEECHHENQSINEMIKARAMNGIKVVRYDEPFELVMDGGGR